MCRGSFMSCNNWKNDIKKSNRDVVLMDIEMTGINGIAATRLIKKEFPAVKILMQTVFEDDAKIFEALCAGANGYILKNTSPVKMLEAITDVQNGGVAFNPRSEEHTSELQSRLHLVCRLLLEKKNK